MLVNNSEQGNKIYILDRYTAGVVVHDERDQVWRNSLSNVKIIFNFNKYSYTSTFLVFFFYILGGLWWLWSNDLFPECQWEPLGISGKYISLNTFQRTHFTPHYTLYETPLYTLQKIIIFAWKNKQTSNQCSDELRLLKNHTSKFKDKQTHPRPYAFTVCTTSKSS